MVYFISHTIGQSGLHPSPALHCKTYHVLLIYFSKCPRFSTIRSYAQNVAFEWFLPYNQVQYVGERVSLLNAAFQRTAKNVESQRTLNLLCLKETLLFTNKIHPHLSIECLHLPHLGYRMSVGGERFISFLSWTSWQLCCSQAVACTRRIHHPVRLPNYLLLAALDTHRNAATQPL